MINIKIFSDYIWPYCYVGEGIIKKLEDEYDLDIEWIGMEIHPETPEDGVELEKRFGKEGLKNAVANLNKNGKKYGISFKDLVRMPNSHNALEAAEYAREMGVIDQYHESLMKGYFTDGVDIGDVSELARLGEAVGLNSDELRKRVEGKYYKELLDKNLKLAHSWEINSTPTFVIDEKYAIVGAQPIDQFRKILDKLSNSK